MSDSEKPREWFIYRLKKQWFCKEKPIKIANPTFDPVETVHAIDLSEYNVVVGRLLLAEQELAAVKGERDELKSNVDYLHGKYKEQCAGVDTVLAKKNIDINLIELDLITVKEERDKLRADLSLCRSALENVTSDKLREGLCEVYGEILDRRTNWVGPVGFTTIENDFFDNVHRWRFEAVDAALAKLDGKQGDE